MYNIGRSDRIRTCGLLVPNQAHYQTVPHPDVVSFDILLTCAIGEGTEPPNAAFAAEASHIPNCATPRESLFWIFLLPCAIGEGTQTGSHNVKKNC